MRRRTLLALLVVLGVLVGSLPAAASEMAVGDAGGPSGSATPGIAAAAASQQSNGTRNETGVNASIGQQLSTVVSVTRADAASTIERRAFTVATEGANESSTAAAVAERAVELRKAAAAIREAYRNATAAYESGELTTSEYAQRLAVLNARARSVRQAHQRLRSVAANVSTPKLRAAGYQPARTREAVASLAPVTGVGVNALRKRFTGERGGTVTIETGAGLDISVGGERGRRVRELDRRPDDSHDRTVSQAAALDAARAALSATNGSWVLTGSSIREGAGGYRFRFRLDADGARGRATVVVDGSSGRVVRLRERVRSRAARNDRGGDGRSAGQERTDERAHRGDGDGVETRHDRSNRSTGNDTRQRSGNRTGTDRPADDQTTTASQANTGNRTNRSAAGVAHDPAVGRFGGSDDPDGASADGHRGNSTTETTSRTDD